MIDGKTIVAVIPARGGSKGVPRKNIRLIAGKPLLAWTIEEAKKSKYTDRVILSTEDDEIISVARRWGCEVPFKRPLELAKDDTPGIDPVLHALESMESDYDYVVVLQPTSPMRRASDIDACIEECLSRKTNVCVSVSAVDKSPYWMYSLDEEKRLRPLFPAYEHVARRQDLPTVYMPNGAVFVAKVPWLLKNRTFVADDTVACCMAPAHSIDVDSEIDFRVCELMLMERGEN
jgi:CMP-N,N'-diacetyllegionaminic acid synthase